MCKTWPFFCTYTFVSRLYTIIIDIAGFTFKVEVLCMELDYTLQRLIRGLSSQRKFARLGFSMALTEVCSF